MGHAKPQVEASAERGPAAATVSPTAHYKRLIGVILLGVAGFIGLRTLMVPASFGQVGHYRYTALADLAAQTIRYQGSDGCATCHEERVATLKGGKHAWVPCETCHGPALGHSAEGADRVALVVEREQTFCLACHQRLVGKPTGFPQISLAEHRENIGFGDEPCLECHEAHDPSL